MPPVPLALDAVTTTRDQEAAPSARSPMPLQPGDNSAKAPPLAPGRSQLETRGDRPRRLLGLLRRALRTDGSYYDPLFERPDLVEDDYYRFRNQPRGW